MEHWLRNASTENRKVAGEANGHVLEQLLKVKEYDDVDAAYLLRDGEPRVVTSRARVSVRIRCCNAWRSRSGKDRD